LTAARAFCTLARMANDLERLVATSIRELHGIVGRADPARVAAEVARLNAAVREAAAPRLHWGDQPGDFAATLLRNADPANG
jgi:hypothetical protein